MSGGLVTTDFGSDDYGKSMVLQADGKILVAGVSNYDFALARYNANGTLDTSLSNNGLLTTDFGGGDHGWGVALQADGKILVVGKNKLDIALVRYNNNGTLDTSFSDDGLLTTDFGNDDAGICVALQTDGKILVAGLNLSIANGDYDFALVRYNADGTLDTNFSGDGRLNIDFGGRDAAYSVALQNDDKILVAGVSNANGDMDFALARYTANGAPDTSFSDNGILTTDFGGGHDYGNSMVLQADGKILVAGTSDTSDGDFALARYNPDGSLDTSFSGDGLLTTDFGDGTVDSGSSVALQADGKILVAGNSYSYINGSWDFALARYNPDGTLDTSFSGDGLLTTDFGSGDYGRSVALQADGKILVAGYSGNNVSGDFALARYNPDGSLDTSFGVESGNEEPEPTVITGTSGNDKLIGTTGDDEINGLAGNDQLDGAAGNDAMSGGKGNDTYRVSDSGDTVTELTGEGTDLVNSDLAAYTLAANVENGRIMRTDAANLTGNTLNNTLYAGTGDNVLDGAAGSDTASYTYSTAAVTVSLSVGGQQETEGSGFDTLLNIEHLTGSRYDDILIGNASANTLDGGSGADTLQGRSGNDSLVGGLGDDMLSGGAGNDVLKGGAGNDILSGGLGKDSFVFDTALSATSNRDTITDFNVADDTIRLENNIFKKLTKTGTLSNDHFASNTSGTAQDADDYIIYESDSGVLAYDADGNGAGAAIQFAVIGVNLSLTAADFTVI